MTPDRIVSRFSGAWVGGGGGAAVAVVGVAGGLTSVVKKLTSVKRERRIGHRGSPDRLK